MATKGYLKWIGFGTLILLVSASLVFAGTGQRSLTAKGVEPQADIDNPDPAPPEGFEAVPSLGEAEETKPSAGVAIDLPQVYQEKLEAGTKLVNSLSAAQRAEMAAVFGRHQGGLQDLQRRTRALEKAFGADQQAEPSLGEMQDLSDSVHTWKADLDDEVSAILDANQRALYEASQVPLIDPVDVDTVDDETGLGDELLGGPSAQAGEFGLSRTDCYYGYYYHYYQYLNDYYAYLYAYYGYAATGNTNAYYAYVYCYNAYVKAYYAYRYCYWAYYYSSATYAYYGYAYSSNARHYAYYGYYYSSLAYSQTGNGYLYYAKSYAYNGYNYAYYGYDNAYDCYYASTANILSVPLYKQEKNQWCWAGTAQMIMKYKTGATYSQCGMANYVRNYSTCCSSSAPSYCNYPTYLDENGKLYTGYGFNRTVYSSYLSFSAVQAQINANRPFFWGWYWTGGGGHAMAVKGYSGNYVYFNDPWEPQAKVCVYSACVSASDHTWGSTIYNIYK